MGERAKVRHRRTFVASPFGLGGPSSAYACVRSVPFRATQESPWSQLHAGMGLTRHADPCGQVPTLTSVAGMVNSVPLSR